MKVQREVAQVDSRQRQYQRKRNIQHKAGDRRRGRGQMPPWLLAMGLLLILNLIFFIHLQSQIKDIQNTLNQVIQGQASGQVHSASSGSVQEPQPSNNPPDSQTASGNDKNAREDESQETQSPDKEPKEDYVTLCGLTQVDKPVKRSRSEALQRLKELAEDSELIEKICKNAEKYSDKMLEVLANNPEMADFVAGYPTAEAEPQGGFTDSEKEQEYPLFLQWDPRWGYVEYGDCSIVGLGGCGPTCLSMVMYYLSGNDMLTPDYIARYSMDNGYYVRGTGTAWALLEDFPALYGIDVEQMGKSEEQMKAALDQGKLLICSMSPGDFTTGGHFIVIYGYDRNGFWVNDPNCVARSRKSWTYEEISSQIKQIWTYGKGGKPVKTVTAYGDGADGDMDGLTDF